MLLLVKHIFFGHYSKHNKWEKMIFVKNLWLPSCLPLSGQSVFFTTILKEKMPQTHYSDTHVHYEWMLSCFSRVQLFATLWSVAHETPLSMGFSRQEIWSGLPCPPLGDLPYSGIQPKSLMFLALPGGFFTASAPWEAHMNLIVAVQSLSCVWLFVTPWTAAFQACLSFTISQSLLKFKSIESVMPSNHLILCRPLLRLPSIFPSIRVFSSESALCIRWPEYLSFSFITNPSNKYSGLISFRINRLDLLAA